MKTLTLALALLIGGCASLTPREKHALVIVGAVVVAGAVAAHEADNNGHRTIGLPDCMNHPDQCR